MPLRVSQFLCLTDNFGLLAHDPQTGATAAIDAPDGAAVLAELDKQGWTLTDILLTHHHPDHIQGTPELKARFPKARIVGPRKETARIPDMDVLVSENDEVSVGARVARVIETPGHTVGHIAYHFADDNILFVGDTLFSLGCGRVFETPMNVMYDSLMKLANLPDETQIFCGHEYTQANARFAASVEKGNALLDDRVKRVNELRAAGKFTLPTTLALERATNPFLRCEESDVQDALGLRNADPQIVFGELRARKDRA